MLEEEMLYTLPHDDSAESAVVGSLMLSSDAFSNVIDILSPNDFYNPKYKIIFDAQLYLFGEGVPVDAITVSDYLETNNKLKNVGGKSTLYAVIESVVTTANVEYYANIVRDRSILRDLISAGDKIKQLGLINDGTNVSDALNLAQEEIYKLGQETSKGDLIGLRQGLDDTIKVLHERANSDGSEGIKTGIDFLDEQILHGLRGGQMVVIAARPGVGKSTFALDIARNAAFVQGKPTIIFNLEMAYSEILIRLISAQKEINHKNLVKGDLTDYQWQLIEQFQNELKLPDGKDVPIFIDDSANISIMQIRTKCRKLSNELGGLGLVIIDYLQLMSLGGRVESRQLEVADLSRKLKLLAKELNVPVIAISQLNRGSEQRSDQQPKLSDLRDSGAIEQDADVVMLLHRKANKRSNSELSDENASSYTSDDDADLINIDIAKNRSGTTTMISVNSLLHYSKFGTYPVKIADKDPSEFYSKGRGGNQQNKQNQQYSQNVSTSQNAPSDDNSSDSLAPDVSFIAGKISNNEEF